MHTRPGDKPERTIKEGTVPSRFPDGKFGQRPLSGTDSSSDVEEAPQVLLVGGSDECAGRRGRKRRRVRLSGHCPQKAGGFVRTFEDNVVESGTAAHSFAPRAASVQDGVRTDVPPGNTGAFAPASAVFTNVNRVRDACREAKKSLERGDFPVLSRAWKCGGSRVEPARLVNCKA